MKVYSTCNSKKMNDHLKEYLAGGVHSIYRLKDKKVPIHFCKADKSRIWDIDGNEYLDLNAKTGAMFLGHGNRRYQEALKECIDHVMTVDLTEYDIRACEYLQKYVPCCEKVQFGLSGTEIIQNALRLARAYTSKNKIIRFEGHFHGTSDNILGGTVKQEDTPFPIDDGIGPFSTLGRAKNVLESETLLIPWNDIQVFKETVSKYNDDIAAVIMEPVNLNSGSIMPAENYLKEVQEVCKENHILLIFDETITGIRMGLGGAQSTYGIIPDLAILGKSIGGGGLPLSALTGKKEIMDLYSENRVVHGGTFNGYPLSMAALISVFDIITDGTKAYERLNYYSAQIADIFGNVAKSIGIEMTVQGPAGGMSYHCRENPIMSYSQLDDDTIVKNGIVRHCLCSHGILVSHMSRMYTNISMNDDDMEFFEKRVKVALEEAALVITRLSKRK